MFCSEMEVPHWSLARRRHCACGNACVQSKKSISDMRANVVKVRHALLRSCPRAASRACKSMCPVVPF